MLLRGELQKDYKKSNFEEKMRAFFNKITQYAFKILHNAYQKLRDSNLKDLYLKTFIFLWKMQIVKGCTIYTGTVLHLSIEIF